MSNRPSLAVSIVAALALAAIIWVMVQFGGRSLAGPSERAFFSTDDGATWFTDDAQKIPPFQKDGKTAYLAHVFTCDGGKTSFVLYLERYSPAVKKLIEADRAKGVKRDAMFYHTTFRDGTQVKPPRTSDAGWVNQEDERGWKIIEPKCPDGRTTNIQQVFP